jgi:AAA+ ATPase superfamily predicted ATPase
MNPRDFFPLGRALGMAFCNRTTETEWLTQNIQAIKHSLLVAPRRFGKSSLAERAIEMSRLPVVTLNFNTCADEGDVETVIRQGVGQLIGKAIGPVDKLLHVIKNYARHLTPTLSVGTEYLSLELTANKQSSPAINVEEALNLIENLLKENKSFAVLVLDEFQAVGSITKGTGVEAAIRNAAQNMRHLTLVFSGSNRHLLVSMFEDESKPLYKICRKLQIKRIEKIHYRTHLNQAAQMAWQNDLPEDIFEHIILLSECHPYYVNYLCDVLWAKCGQLPNINDVNQAWETVREEEHSDINMEMASLSLKQKKVIKYIAQHSGVNLMSAEATRTTGMALSSLATAVKGLLEKDIIEKSNNDYFIINPMLNYVLKF